MSENSDPGVQGKRQLPKAWRFVLVVLVIVAVIALFYGEEDWRGRRAWAKYQQQLAARGEPVSAAQLVPPRVPDNENFAMTPFLAPLFEFEPGTQHRRDTNALAEIQAFPRDFKGPSSEGRHGKKKTSTSWVPEPLDLNAWCISLQETNSKPGSQQQFVTSKLSPAQAGSTVLALLARYDPVIEELRTASRRPYSRFNLAYDSPNPAAILLPHLAFLKRTSRLLQVRACAELAAGRTEQAAADLDLMFYLAQCIRNEPILISHLVRIAESHLVLQPLAQGLVNHQWSDPQLTHFEEQLANFDFCADGRRALEGERILFGGGVIDYIRNAPDKFRALSSLGGPPDQGGSGFDAVAAFYTLAPSGWLDFEKLNYHRAFEEILLPTFDLSAGHVDPEAVRQANAKIEGLLKLRGPAILLHHRFFIGLLLPAVAKVVERSAQGQTALNEAALACALERYRIARGIYPESLEDLAPRFISKIPRDLRSGQPLKYERSDGGHKYVLQHRSE